MFLFVFVFIFVFQKSLNSSILIVEQFPPMGSEDPSIPWV